MTTTEPSTIPSIPFWPSRLPSAAWLTWLPTDRSHHRPPGGHRECGQPGCREYQGNYYNGSSESDLIKDDTMYLCRIGNDWFTGTFSRVWFGWSFNGWVNPNGIQLNAIWLVYRIDGLPDGPEIHEWKPPRTPKPEDDDE